MSYTMGLAGIIDMGDSNQSFGPDNLKCIFVKGQEDAQPNSGKNKLRVFHPSHEAVVEGKASTGRPGEMTEVAIDNAVWEASTGKQTSITDFFSPRPASDASAFETNLSLAGDVHENSFLLKDADTTEARSYVERARSHSMPPSSPTVWENSPLLESSNQEALPKSATQPLGLFFPIVPRFGEEQVSFNTFSRQSSVPWAEDVNVDSTENNDEQYWTNRDEDRLRVIKGIEKEKLETETQLASVTRALHIAFDAYHKLQVKLEKNMKSFSQMDEERANLVHSLDANDMRKEELERDSTFSQEDQRYRCDTAEEAVTLMSSDPFRRTIAKFFSSQERAETHNRLQQREMESEMDFLESQLKERCNSVARLTRTLSRVADFDRWRDVQQELDDLVTGAGTQLRQAWLECDDWREAHDTVWGAHQQLQADYASLKVTLRDVQELDLRAVRRLKGELDTALSERQALKGSLRQVFERMVRCSLCLETDGFLPFDRKHREICKQVLELTGEDYQPALFEYYSEHEISDEFRLIADDSEREDEAEDKAKAETVDGTEDERDDEAEACLLVNSGGQAGFGDYLDMPDDTGFDEGYTHNIGVDTSTSIAAPADIRDLPFPSSIVTTEGDNVRDDTAKEDQAQQPFETQGLGAKEHPNATTSPEQFSHTTEDAEEVQDPLKMSNTKTLSASVVFSVHSLADSPNDENTPHVFDTGHAPIQAMDNTYSDDAEYWNKYENMVDDVDDSDGEKREYTIDAEEGAEQVGESKLSQTENFSREENTAEEHGHGSQGVSKAAEVPPSPIHQREVVVTQNEYSGVNGLNIGDWQNMSTRPVSARGNVAGPHTALIFRQQCFLNAEILLSTPAASPRPASDETFVQEAPKEEIRKEEAAEDETPKETPLSPSSLNQEGTLKVFAGILAEEAQGKDIALKIANPEKKGEDRVGGKERKKDWRLGVVDLDRTALIRSTTRFLNICMAVLVLLFLHDYLFGVVS